MTTILYGDRALAVATVQSSNLGLKPVDCKVHRLDVPESFEVRWRQLNPLKPEKLLFLDPPATPKKLVPREGYWLFFEGKVPAGWDKWAKKHGVKTQGFTNPAPEQLYQMLVGGAVRGLVFAPDAADWYVQVAGTSMVRLSHETEKLALAGHTRISRELIVRLVGGEEASRADAILKALGTERALGLVAAIKDTEAHGLKGYLLRALANRRNGWVRTLTLIWEAADAGRFDYWAAMQLFAHHCYQAKKKGEAVATLETLRVVGVVRWA